MGLNNKKLSIKFYSLIKSPASWAGISRRIITQLQKKGIDIKTIPQRGFLYDKNFPTPSELEKTIQKKNTSCIVGTSFNHPNFYKNICEKIKTSFLVYETYPLPYEWVENINQYLDYIFVPNNYNKNIFFKSGVKKEKIVIIPYGYPGEIKPKKIDISKKETNFLSIAMPHKRKGIDILIKSFCNAFTFNNKVSLTIKTFYTPKEKNIRKPWETEPIEIIVKKTIKKYKFPPKIKVINKKFSDEEMLKFYKSFDIYLQPSLAEGFGLAILEAMASGLLCIVTGWGGHIEFCNENNSLLINYTLKKRKNIAYSEKIASKPIQVAVPDISHLSYLLKTVHQNKKIIKEKTSIAIESIKEYTWEKSVQKFIDFLEKVV